MVDFTLPQLNIYGKVVLLLAFAGLGLPVFGGSTYLNYSIALLVPISLTLAVALYRDESDTDAERNPHDDEADSSERSHEPDGSKGKPLAEY